MSDLAVATLEVATILNAAAIKHNLVVFISIGALIVLGMCGKPMGP